MDCLYEAASAVGTVGLTLGITPGLHVFSQVVLIILMYLGTCRGIDPDLCSIFRKKQGQCKAASGENYSWMRRRKKYYEECIDYRDLEDLEGMLLCSLTSLGHEIMAVDWNEERVDKVLPFVTNAQIGDSTNAEFLQSLGIGNYDICFVTIGGEFSKFP